MEFTNEQTQILSETNSSFRVLAAAGSGKTSTMAYYVKGEIESGRTLETEICFITFTRFAAEQIKTKMMKIMGRTTKVLYGTFHATMWKLLYYSGITIPDPVSLYDARMEQGVMFFIDLMKKKDHRLVKVLAKFKILIVDEFQDLDQSQFEFVKLCKEIQPALRIVAIGDLAQNIYRFRGTSNEFLRTLLLKDVDSSLKSFKLTTNFRSTKKILTFVNRIFREQIKNEHILPMCADKEAEEGIQPHYYEYAKNPGKGPGEYEYLVVKTLMPIIKKAKENKQSVVLIFPIIKCSSFQMLTALLRNSSKREGYAFDIHQIAKEDETCSTVVFDYNPQDPNAPIQCSTFHSSKGLEWDVVAIINMSDAIYENRSEEEETEAFYAEKTNLAYVGITRAAKELYIFADANKGGRCRLFAALGEELTDAMKCTFWGIDQIEYNPGKLRPIGVTELIRKFPQFPELYKRAIQCSESIKIISAKDGIKLPMEYVYNEMKKRNRELALGTYIDWKLKQILCKGKSKTFQDALIELFSLTGLYLSKGTAFEDIEQRLMKLDIYFLNSNKDPNEELVKYITASRHIALFSGRIRNMVPELRSIWSDVGKTIMEISKKEDKTIKEEYIFSQAINFYIRNVVSEIQAVEAPVNLYQGLPADFEEFVRQTSIISSDVIRNCIRAAGITADTEICGDVPLESKCLILGEADMVAGDLLIEIKCGSTIKSIEMRESGSCKHLLQILTYITLGRHGTIPLECKKACLVNPLTGTWEMYDIESWPIEDSLEFMDVLEELHLQA